MSTHSNIGILNQDGSVTFIYCHSDGYPSYVGKILREHYTDEAKVRELIGLGDLSSIGPVIGVKHKFDDFSPAVEHMCRAYHRDRGEEWKDTKPRSCHSETNFYRRAKREASYAYLFKDGKWHICRSGGKESFILTAELCGLG